MREIKFRGMKEKDGEWIYGLFARHEIGSLILPCIQIEKESDSGDYMVYEEIKGHTLGQYTGLKDKNDKNIYEGDIIKIDEPSKNHQIQEVIFKDGAFCGYSDKKPCPYTLVDVLIRAHGVEVVGNKFES